MAEQSEIRYLNAPSIDTKKKKYCRFKKSGIKYIDYNRVAQAVKRARQIALLPYVTDLMK